MEELIKKLDKLLIDLENKNLQIAELECGYGALSELLIDHLANGDNEQKNYLFLRLEQLSNEIFYKRFPKKSS